MNSVLKLYSLRMLACDFYRLISFQNAVVNDGDVRIWSHLWLLCSPGKNVFVSIPLEIFLGSE